MLKNFVKSRGFKIFIVILIIAILIPIILVGSLYVADSELSCFDEDEKKVIADYTDNVILTKESGIESSITSEEVWNELEDSGKDPESYLDNESELKYLMNAELVTQMPKVGSPEGTIDGTIIFKRRINKDDSSMLLSYVDNETFQSYIDEYNTTGNSDAQNNALTHFTIENEANKKEVVNEDGEKTVSTFVESNVIVASWTEEDNILESNDSDIQSYEHNTHTMTKEKINYKNYVNKYTMPFEFLWTLLITSDSKEFVMDVAKLAYDSEIEITLYDNYNETKNINTYTYNKKRRNYINAYVTIDSNYGVAYARNRIFELEEKVTNGNNNYEDVYDQSQEAYQFKVVSTVINRTDTITLGITKAKTWIVDYTKNYNVDTEKPDGQDEEVQTDSTESNYEKVSERTYVYPSTENRDLTQIKEVQEYFKEQKDKVKNEANKEEEKENLINEKLLISTPIENEKQLEIAIINNVPEYDQLSIRRQNAVLNSLKQLINEQVKNIKSFNELNEFSTTMEKVIESYPDVKFYLDLININTDEKVTQLIKNAINDYFSEIITEEDVTQISSSYIESLSYINRVEEITYIKKENIKQINNQTRSNTSYMAGKTETKDNTQGIINVINNSEHRQAKKNLTLIDTWLFDYLENDEETANMVDLMKYILNRATNSESYGNNLEFDDIWTNMFVMKNAKNGADISLTTSMFTKGIFVQAVENYKHKNANFSTFLQDAGGAENLYELGVNYNVNPELIITIALKESSFKKNIPTNYNYWGLDTPNGSTRAQIDSFEIGVQKLRTIIFRLFKSKYLVI